MEGDSDVSIDWNTTIQVATFILFITGWVAMYGNYRAARASGEALLASVSKDTTDIKNDLRRVDTNVGKLNERMVRVETKLGLDG